MKTLYILFIASIILASCTPTTEAIPIHCVSVIHDVTDPLIVNPDPNSILEYYDFSNKRNQEAYFRYRQITDLQLNPVMEYRLPNNNVTEKENKLDDTKFREKYISLFYQKIRTAVLNITIKDSATLQHSEIFKTVSDELAIVSKRTATMKKVFVFSDLRENSDVLNMYEPAVINTIFNYPKQISDKLAKTGLLPDSLKNISVYFIFSPPNRSIDKLYNSIVAIYKALLENKGATVYILANSDFKQL